MSNYVGSKADEAAERLADFEKRSDPNDKDQQKLLQEMRAHLKKVGTKQDMPTSSQPKITPRSHEWNKNRASNPLSFLYLCAKLEEIRKNEDPRLSFSTPEFKEAQRIFTDNFKRNFDRPVEWAMVKEFPWSTPTLRKLEQPVDVNGNPWPADKS